MSAERNAYNQAIQCITCDGCSLRQLPLSYWEQTSCTPNEAADVIDTAFSEYDGEYARSWGEEEHESVLARRVGDFFQNVLPIPEFTDEDRPGALVGSTAEELLFVTEQDGEVDQTPFLEMQPDTRRIITCIEKVITGECGPKQRGQQHVPLVEVDIDLSALGSPEMGASVLETYARSTPETELWAVFERLLPNIEQVLAVQAARSGRTLVLPEFTAASNPGEMREILFAAAEHLRDTE